MKTLLQLADAALALAADFRHAAPAPSIDVETEIAHQLAEQALDGALTPDDQVRQARTLFVLGILMGKYNHLPDRLSIRSVLESLLDLDDEQVMSNFRSWDNGDCSIVGLIEILLAQEIAKHKKSNGEFYDTDYDQIRLRYS